MNTKEILENIVAGQRIKPKIIQGVYEDIMNNRGNEYSNLLVIGRSCSMKYVSLVQSYLYCKEDPMLARLALQILCRYWAMSSKYVNNIKNFIGGVNWDVDEDVKLMAISCASEVFKEYFDRDLLRMLYNIFIDIKNEDDINRAAAYTSMAIIVGINISSIPTPARFNIKNDIDENILEKVVKLIK